MTDKEFATGKTIIIVTIGFLIGIIIGMAITEIRINSEIRTDQIELKVQVAEIMDKKEEINDLVQKLIFEIEQIQADRQELRELKIIWSKGE